MKKDQNTTVFSLRIPTAQYEKLKQQAAENERSVNSELLHLLKGLK